MNKKMFFTLSVLFAINVSCSSREKSNSLRKGPVNKVRTNSTSRKTRSFSLKRTFSEKSYNLKLTDKYEQNEIVLNFGAQYVTLPIFLNKLAQEFGCERENVRLQVDKNSYGRPEKEINFSKPWFKQTESGYAFDISELKKIANQDLKNLFYICKRRKYFIEYEEQKISYTEKFNDEIGKTIVKFNLNNFDFPIGSDKNEIIDAISTIYCSLDEEKDFQNYEFTSKNAAPIIQTTTTNNSLKLVDKKPLNFVFPDVASGIKYLTNINVFENNYIGKIEIQDINEVFELNRKMSKNKIIKLLDLLEKEGVL